MSQMNDLRQNKNNNIFEFLVNMSLNSIFKYRTMHSESQNNNSVKMNGKYYIYQYKRITRPHKNIKFTTTLDEGSGDPKKLTPFISENGCDFNKSVHVFEFNSYQKNVTISSKLRVSGKMNCTDTNQKEFSIDSLVMYEYEIKINLQIFVSLI